MSWNTRKFACEWNVHVSFIKQTCSTPPPQKKTRTPTHTHIKLTLTHTSTVSLSCTHTHIYTQGMARVIPILSEKELKRFSTNLIQLDDTHPPLTPTHTYTQGVTRVITLMSEDELKRYSTNLIQLYDAHFFVALHIPLQSKDAWHNISQVSPPFFFPRHQHIYTFHSPKNTWRPICEALFPLPPFYSGTHPFFFENAWFHTRHCTSKSFVVHMNIYVYVKMGSHIKYDIRDLSIWHMGYLLTSVCRTHTHTHAHTHPHTHIHTHTHVPPLHTHTPGNGCSRNNGRENCEYYFVFSVFLKYGGKIGHFGLRLVLMTMVAMYFCCCRAFLGCFSSLCVVAMFCWSLTESDWYCSPWLLCFFVVTVYTFVVAVPIFVLELN